jgi:hypothetical protein
MDKPHIADAPGLAWRPRSNGWAAVWLARQDIAKKGFKPSTRQIVVLTEPPTEAQETAVRAACVKFQEEMYEFGNAQPRGFDGTLRALVNAYQTDPDSPYHGLEYYGRKEFDTHARHLVREHGHLKLDKIGARDFKHIYELARWPAGKDESPGKVSLAHKRIGMVRRMVGFGMAFEIHPACTRLRPILSELRFENGKARTESMTLRQCENIIAAAHKAGLPSIALAQAIQFDFRVRQRDVIGVWLPVTEPGISTIPPRRGRKWLRGMRHEEISSTMLMSHPISKSRRHGKVLERDLTLYPMVMAEYERIPVDKRTGPLVICERTGRPWKANHFRQIWREVAIVAGVPKEVWNMDNRASGISETIEATGGNVEAARKEADHSRLEQTVRYSRRKRQSIDDTAAKVLDFRAKNKG